MIVVDLLVFFIGTLLLHDRQKQLFLQHRLLRRQCVLSVQLLGECPNECKLIFECLLLTLVCFVALHVVHVLSWVVDAFLGVDRGGGVHVGGG